MRKRTISQTRNTQSGKRAANQRGGRLEPAAGQDGRPLSGGTIRRNGRLQFVGDFVDVLDPPTITPAEPSRLDELRRRLAKVRAQYRLSGMFTERELTIMDLAFEGHSLDSIGKHVGIKSRQGVEYHVQRLMARAQCFRNLWRYKNRMRGRK